MLPNLSSLVSAPSQPGVANEDAKGTVLRELGDELVSRFVETLVYDPDKGLDNETICDLMLSYCGVQKFACSNDYVFEEALRAFGVNSEFKKLWLYSTWAYLSRVYPSLVDVPLNETTTQFEDVTNRRLFGFCCTVVRNANAAFDESYTEWMQTLNVEEQLEEMNVEDSEAVIAAIQYHANNFYKNVDKKAVFALSTLASPSFSKMEMVKLWRRVVSNIYPDQFILRFDSVYRSAESGKRPYPLLPNDVSIQVAQNMAWYMADLFNPDFMLLVENKVRWFADPSSAPDGQDGRPVNFILPLSYKYESRSGNYNQADHNAWSGYYWFNLYIKEWIRTHDLTGAIFDTLQDDVHQTFYPGMRKADFKVAFRTYLRVRSYELLKEANAPVLMLT